VKVPLEENTNIFLADKIVEQLPAKQSSSGAIFFCAHIGLSMNPTLNAHDLLEIQPYHQKAPRVGDVILFHPPAHDYYVVHRIFKLKGNDIITRGDNNGEIDSCFLKKVDICGRIIAAHRGDRRRKIANGFLGAIKGRFCHLRRIILYLCIMLLRPVFRSFCTNGILHWLIPVRLSPQVATFLSGTKASHKLLLGKQVIGFFDDNLLQWQIKSPYRILVDESSLPTPR
jgi:hypothetical protein